MRTKRGCLFSIDSKSVCGSYGLAMEIVYYIANGKSNA